ncbi:G patch domain-containing protein 4 [Ostrinia furnacalis]|uniref:G patch domain-containing protein 4 n=1 Tax=Ostrinia furnacalis TaxID=93504 RepID=UPI00103C216D|nr:G patch domain-containing protein 4 [Ostrinia furnacalis]
MNFARKQLEKYGWTDGKGLGKHENGISEALKPKLKRSVAGIGHDAASDFTEHWWTKLYDKAAGNVEVEEKNGKTKKIKTKEDEFEITNSTWKLKKKKKQSDTEEEQYKDYFVRKAVLSGGGSTVRNVNDSESEDETAVTKDVFKMTDEELFAACEGRTAHKGARHGLKATGKLARIAQQEQILLTQPQYTGYSHAKKLKKNNEVQDNEESNPNPDVDSSIEAKKKKKRKRKLNNSDNKNCDENAQVEYSSSPLPEDDEKSKQDNVASDKNEDEISTSANSVEDIVEVKRKKKKSKNLANDTNTNEQEIVDDSEETPIRKRKKKKKNASE